MLSNQERYLRNGRLLPKKSKPTVKDFRPVALTNVNYKLMMSLIRDRVYEHMERLKEVNDLQAGFTSGRRMEDNIFVLTFVWKTAGKEKKN